VPSLLHPHASDHVVQFYESDADLIARAGAFLAGDDVPVVIATEPHRAAFAAALGEREDAILLDAAETLARFMSDGRIDRAAFDAVIGGVIREAAASGRPVRAFGEMVALLWERGDLTGAIELETLWNGLRAAIPFSLYCAYPSASVHGGEHAAELERICQAHTAVETTWEFPLDDGAPADARHRLAEALAHQGHPRALLDDARIVVTELAANAVVHAGSPFSVCVRGDGGRVRIGVRDNSRAMPAPQEPSAVRLSGRGLQLVSAIASRWGVEPLVDGKVVWADLHG
jgi:anti-sigma regulatory factor (Ser/Thr protein kinase)